MEFSISLPQFTEIGSAVLRALNSKDEKAQTTFKIFDLENQPKLLIQCHSHTALFEGNILLQELKNNENDSELSWKVDGSQLKVILSVLPKVDTNITFKMNNTNRLLTVSACGNEYRLPVYEAPMLSTDNEEITELAEVNAVSFLNYLSNITKYTFSEDLSKNIPISCVHLYLKKEQEEIILVATNSVALAEIKQPVSVLEDVKEDTVILIKNIQANLLLTSYAPADVLKIVETKSKFGYIDKNGTVCLVSKVDLNPINYEPIKGKIKTEQSITALRDDLKFATDSLGKLCPADASLTFVFEDENLAIRNGNNDNMKVEVFGDFDNVKMSIFRSNLSIIYSTLTEKVKINWGKEDKKKVIQFCCLDESGNKIDNIFICLATNEGV